MKKILRIIAEITIDALRSIGYFIKSNLQNFAIILNIALPYVMYFIGQYVATDRKGIAVGGELFVPIFFIILIFYLKSTANKLGKGITIPVPDKRFTKVEDDGEVTIENKRVQELILYLADLEDWLERKGLL
jgi:hypothetical protein